MAAFFGNLYHAGIFFAPAYFNGAGQGPPTGTEVREILDYIGGRGSGPTNGIKPWREPYRQQREDALRETRLARIRQQDSEIEEMIVALITKGIL